MNIGRLRHYITIQTPTLGSPSTSGQRTASWSDFRSVWASVEPVGSREFALAKSMAATTNFKVTIRATEGITTKMRIAFKSRTFAINGVRHIDERGRMMELYCTEVAA